MMVQHRISDEELERHIRWQVLVSAELDVWANLPEAMTPVLEWAARELWARPIRFAQFAMFEHRVFPEQTQTNVETGMVRRKQRVVVLSI